MRRRTCILILAALAVQVIGACTHVPVSVPTGSVTISFSTGAHFTRTGDGVVADGGGISITDNLPDLKILLVDADGNVTARYPGGGSLQSASATEAVVQFTAIPEGDYLVYAAANTESSLTVESVDWTTISTMAELDALMFTELSDLTPPDVGEMMPLSTIGLLSVNASSNGYVSLEMLRCVAKVEVLFKNLTGDSLTIEGCDITLQDINPTTAYFFPPDSDDSAGSSRDLAIAQDTSLEMDTSENQKISAGKRLVFPSLAPESEGRYCCDVSFTVGGEEKTFTDLPIHDSKSKDITSLGRNQYLKIEIRISNQTDISFNFEVCDWTLKTETVEFN